MELIVLALVVVFAIGIGIYVTRKPKELPGKEPDGKGGELPERGERATPREDFAATKPSVQSRTPKAPKEVEALRAGLTASRKGFVGRLFDLVGGKTQLEPAVYTELEEVLLTSDVGPSVTGLLLERLRDRLAKKEGNDTNAAMRGLKAEALSILQTGHNKGRAPLKLDPKPTVILMVGVNGVGKTTTIGKLATKLSAEGKKIMLGAADTFRAAAVQQLEVWGERVGAQVVKGKEGADPASVAYEAANQAHAAGVDVLFVDTAGRLHNKAPLMDEIRKVKKTLGKAFEGAPHEVLLVLDATTGQNALNQAALFKETVDLTGIVLTKLDGSAKGGIVLAIAHALKVPVRYIGLGEKAEDLREFDAEAFVEALFSSDS